MRVASHRASGATTRSPARVTRWRKAGSGLATLKPKVARYGSPTNGSALTR